MTYENWKHEQQTELLKNHWLSSSYHSKSNTTCNNDSNHPLLGNSDMNETDDSQAWDEKEPMFLDEPEIKSSSPLTEECHLLAEPGKEDHEEELFSIAKQLLPHENGVSKIEVDLAHEASLLRTAVENKDQHRLLQALEQGISIDLPLIPTGETALCLAITHQNIDLIRFLLNHYASPQPRLYHTLLPLHRAAELGNLTIVELLLKADADVHALSLGHTALDKATTAAIAAVLIDAGMYPKELNDALLWKAADGGKNAGDVVSVVIREGGFVDALDAEGWSGLRWACKRGDEEMVRVLVEAGARVDQVCVDAARLSGHSEIVKFLDCLERM